MKRVVQTMAGAMALVLLSTAAGAQTSLTTTGTLGGASFSSDAWAISRDGSRVVGGSPSSLSGFGDAAFSITLPGGSIVELLPGANDIAGGNYLSRALGVSANGSVVVGLSAYNGTRTHAFKLAAGDASLVDLGNISPQTPALSANSDISIAEAVSDDGSVIVGRGFRQSVNNAEACYWLNGVAGATGIGDLAGGITRSDAHGVSGNGAVIVGEGNSANGREAFSWTQAGGMVGLGDAAGGGFDSSAYAASTDGSVIVGYATTSAGAEAARWSGGSIRTLGDLAGGAVSSAAYGVSANGAVVVGSGDAGRPDPAFPAFTIAEAFVWDFRNGMRRLADVLGPAVPTGYIPGIANGVTITSSATIIVGSGQNAAGDSEGFIAVLPRFCVADANDSGTVTVQDIFDFLGAYFASLPSADVNGSGTVTVQDIFDFLSAYFAGC